MSAHHRTPPGDHVAHPTGFALVKRRHVDLMRVCSAGCRRTR
ncbi:putative leader peptide [Micromonospora mangrovi]|uniref:Leader peptide n=2 Tax=Micromonospora TaxID=1873 RepID=A0AAU7MF57_9ACTN